MKQEFKGYMDKANVCLCSKKLKTLIVDDENTEKTTEGFDLNLNYKIEVKFRKFKKIIKFMSNFAETVEFNIYNHKFYMTAENENRENYRVILPIVDNETLNDLTSDITALSRYSLNYLKDFCKAYNFKDIDKINIWLNKDGQYPLLIEYTENETNKSEWFVLAPRIKAQNEIKD